MKPKGNPQHRQILSANRSRWAQSLALGLLLLSTLGCEKVVELDLNGTDPKLAVDGRVFDVPGRSYVRLMLTANYFDRSPIPGVNDADVVVSDDQGQRWTLSLSPELPGLYLFPEEFVGDTGRTYMLRIKWRGEEFSASDQLRPNARLDSLTWQLDPLIAEDFTSNESPFFGPYRLNVWGRERPGRGDIYRFVFIRNGQYLLSARDLFFQNDDFLFDGAPIPGIDVFYRFQLGDTVGLELWSLSPQSETFYRSLQLQVSSRGGLFDTPPANLQGNISNGCLGFFGASSVVSTFVVVGE